MAWNEIVGRDICYVGKQRCVGTKERPMQDIRKEVFATDPGQLYLGYIKVCGTPGSTPCNDWGIRSIKGPYPQHTICFVAFIKPKSSTYYGGSTSLQILIRNI